MGRKYRNLIHRVADPDNLRDAYRKAARGRTGAKGYLRFKEHDAANLVQLREEILNGSYVCGPARSFTVYEPKPRPISSVPFRDRVVQHALCTVIGPLFEAGMLPHSYACRKGRGSHAGAIYTQSMIRRLGREDGALYCLKTDFSKYFYSIDLPALWKRITAKISCRRTLELIEQFTPRRGRGLRIGYLVSQLWANVAGTAVDRFLAQDKGVKHWARYMDDIVILSHDRAYLHRLRQELAEFSRETMGLTFSKWSVQPVSRGVNFLGFRIFPDYKLLRHDSVKRAKRKTRRYVKAGDKEALARFKAAWRGHARWADSHNVISYLTRYEHVLTG